MMVEYVEVSCPDLVERLALAYRLFWQAGLRDGLVGAPAQEGSDHVALEAPADLYGPWGELDQALASLDEAVDEGVCAGSSVSTTDAVGG